MKLKNGQSINSGTYPHPENDGRNPGGGVQAPDLLPLPQLGQAGRTASKEDLLISGSGIYLSKDGKAAAVLGGTTRYQRTSGWAGGGHCVSELSVAG